MLFDRTKSIESKIDCNINLEKGFESVDLRIDIDNLNKKKSFKSKFLF